MLIALEGIDGSGTTTQLARVATALRAQGRRVYETREPSDGPVGRVLREALRGAGPRDHRAVALLFAADRLDHLHREIEPALARGEVVLCDRYLGSSLVYQSAFCEPDWVRALNRFARLPDITIVLDVPVEEATRRRAARGGRPELFDDPALQAELAQAYRNLASLMPGARVTLVDGSGSPALVEKRILKTISTLAR
jgi:dTMP kinase